MKAVSIIATLALVEYVWFSIQTGQARDRYGVKAPAVTGDPMFERYYRVQQNTLEQLVVFLPSLYLFGFYVSSTLAALLGVAFLGGRFLYARSYVADPETRGVGFGIGAVANVLLLLGSLLGALFT